MYRDEREAALLRLDELRERTAERRAQVSAMLLDSLPEPLAERLSAARREADDAAGDDAVGALQALQAYDAVLDEVFALAPHVEAGLNALPERIAPEHAAPVRRLPLVFMEPAMWPAAAERLPKYLVEIDPDARLAAPEKYRLDAALRFRDVPIGVRLQPHVDTQNNSSGEMSLAMATPVRLSTPALELRPLAFSHSFTKLLRIHRDIEIGDLEIDGRFLVQGDPDLAPVALDEATRRDLLRIAAFDVPRLEIVTTGGVRCARISWRWDAKIGPLKAALRILARMRALDTEVSLIG